jgi:predicted DNA-binding transcriptional regulator YafY
LEAVMLGLRWVTRRGDKELARAANDTIAKIGTVLPESLKPMLFDASLMAPPSWALVDDAVDVSLIRRAIREQRKLELVYRDENKNESTRTIWPIGISYFDAQRLVIAWCELRVGFRTFRTDRMIMCVASDEKYKERRKVLLKRWMTDVQSHGGAPDFESML